MKTPAKITFIVLVAVVLLTVQFASAALAAGPTFNLLPEHVGLTNPGFNDPSPNCGPNPTANFLWVFALVWIDPGTPPGVLTAQFENSGQIVNSTPKLFGGGNMQRFYLYLDVPDKVLGASVTVPTAQSAVPRAPALKLSSVRHDCKPAVVPKASSVSVVLGSCSFANNESRTPATITVAPTGGAIVTLRDTAGTIVATGSGASTHSLAPGTYQWTAVAAQGYSLVGAASGSITTHSCVPKVLPSKIVRPLATTGPPGLGMLAAVGFGFVGIGLLMIAAERRRSRLTAAGFAILVAVGAFALAAFPILLLPLLVLTPWGLGRSAAGISDAGAWIVRQAIGPVIATSRGGVWRPKFS